MLLMMGMRMLLVIEGAVDPVICVFLWCWRNVFGSPWNCDGRRSDARVAEDKTVAGSVKCKVNVVTQQ